MRTKTTCWLVIAAIGCAHASQGRPMTTEIKVTLDKLAELDGGGGRLAVHGALIAAATDDAITVWRDQIRAAAASSPDAIDRVRLSADGKQLLAAPYVFDVAGANWTALDEIEPALLHGLAGPSKGELKVRRTDWSADGKELLVYVEHRAARGVASGSSSGAQARLLWMDRARKVIAVPWTGRNNALTSVGFGAHWAAAGGKQLMVWDRKTHAQVATLDVHSLVIREIAFSPDDKLIASVSNDHKVVLVDTASWKMIANWDAHDGDAVGVAWHPSKPLIATTGQDALVRLWSLDGKRVAEAKLPRAGNAVAFNDDGSKLVVATDDKVIVFAIKP
jgi:WD40 repeat protein